MTLEYRVGGGGKKTVHTVSCPLCGEALEGEQSPADHIPFQCPVREIFARVGSLRQPRDQLAAEVSAVLRDDQEPQRLVADGGVSVSPQAAAKRGGENAEAAVLQTVPELRYVPDSEAVHYDAVAEELLEPSGQLPFTGIPLVEVGTVVEIKSAMVVLADDRRGRLLFRRQQHERLLEDAGMYLVAVCEPTPDRGLLALKLIPATLVDEEIETGVAAEDDPDYAQLAWTRFVHPDEVSR